MKQLFEAVLGIAVYLGILFGGVATIIYLTTPPPHAPYAGVLLPTDLHVVTSRSWYRPSLFNLETYNTFRGRPVALKWLTSGPSGINLTPEAPPLGSGPALVLIHGYNAPESKVSSYFSEVLALLRSEIGSSCPIIVYDWPSTARHWEELTAEERRALIDPGGAPRGMRNSWAPIGHEAQAYRADQDHARRHGADGLVELLRLLTRDGPRPIMILAHSMGALVTVEALRRMLPDGPAIEIIVLLAPDLSADELGSRDFPQMFSRVSHMHVMYSRQDKALWYSEFVNKSKRLGRDGHRTNVPLPARVTVHDVTDRLGDESVAVHGRYLERDGAEAIGLRKVIRQSKDRSLP